MKKQTLSQQTLSYLQSTKADINLPKYNRSQTSIGIVHIGPGAFFRAHQAWYTEQAINLNGGNWGICGVALNSHQVKSQLAPQDGLYSLLALDKSTEVSVIGCLKEVLAYQEDFSLVLARLTAKTTKLVTLTITEKGYYLTNNGHLDLANSVMKSDFLNPQQPQSAIGLLVLACKIRQQQGTPALSIISCDNVNENGHKLKHALVEYAKQLSADLAQYIQTSVICPCTMVDSITPATTDELSEQLAQQFHYQDNWPIKREAFTQWVIEDILPDDIPAWREVGVTFTKDVQAYENAKLRVLNATHSTMAYLGCLLNIETVYDAIHQVPIKTFIQHMLKDEVQVSFDIPAGMNFDEYCQSIIERYQNPEIKHLLAQIAWDGSQKLPMRILPIIEINLKNNQAIKKCCIALAAWMRFVIEKCRNNGNLVDPLKITLNSISDHCNDEPRNDIAQFMSLSMFSSLAQNQQFISQLTKSYQFLTVHNAQEILPLLEHIDH